MANEHDLQRMMQEQRELALDKKSIETQLLAERTNGLRGAEWESRAKHAIARVDLKLASLKNRIREIDPSGRIRSQLKRETAAVTIQRVGSSSEATAAALNELLKRGVRIISFCIVASDLVVVVESDVEAAPERGEGGA